jgi:hypothetical protein
MSNLTPKRRRIYIVAMGLLGVLLASAVVVVLKLTSTLEPAAPEDLKVQQLEQVAARPDRPSALIIGDSFLVPNWPFKRVLGKDLPAYLDRHGVNAVLSAEAGTGPRRYCSEALKLLPKVRPKLVIVFYFVGNDLTDTMSDFQLKPPHLRSCVCNINESIKDKFDWAMMKRCGVDVGLVELAERGQRDADNQPLNPHLICAALRYPQLYRANLTLKGQEARAAWQINKALLRLIQDEARHFGAELHLVVIPAALQVAPIYAKFLRRMNFKIDDELTRSREVQRQLKALCEREKIGYLDLLPACLASPKRRRLYFDYDDHFRQEGHDLAYKQVLEQIIKPWLAARRN